MIQEAWSLKPFQIQLPEVENLPINAYAIDAVMPAGTPRETARQMLRAMLIDRFGLKFHSETKDIPVYALTAAAKPKLEAADPEKAKEREFDTPMGKRKGVQSMSGPGLYIAAYTTLTDFAGQLSNVVDRPVIDLTGIAGTYTIELHWDRTDPMSLIGVVEHQLGLKFEKKKMPYEMFVVDKVNLVPTGN